MRTIPKRLLVGLVATLAICGLTTASALAAGAPIVETKAASSIAGTHAYLNGVVNPNGAETKDYFEYGTTTSYGSKSREQTTTVEKKPSIFVERLSTKTTYHFRMVATNSYGTSYGADEVFTTPTEKPELILLKPGAKYSEFEVEGSSKGVILAWGAQKSMECESSVFIGTFVSSKELEGKMVWHRCFSQTSVCTNGKEEVQSEQLRGTLGYFNKAKKEVGIKLSGASSEVWANKVRCPGGTSSLTGSLGGKLNLPVNTSIARLAAFGLEYEQWEGKQTTGELGGQLLWQEGTTDFSVGARLTASANIQFEIQA